MRLFPLQIFLISFLAHGVLGWGQLRGTFSRGEQDIQKKDHPATAGSNSSASERVHEREHRRRTNNRATINNAALASNNLNLNNRKLKWAEDHPEITKALMEERRKAEDSMNATDSADKGDDYYDDDEALEKGDDYYEKLEEANAAKDNNSGDQGGHKNWEKETSESKVEDMTEISEGPGPVDSEEEEGEENSEDENDDEAPTEDESDDEEEEEEGSEEESDEEEGEDETEDISDQGEGDDIDNQTPVEQNNEEEVEDIISTSSPTAAVVVTASPTVKSTPSPTIASTDSPTTSPTIASTDSPTISPTRLPTKKPTSVPMIVTGSPTQSPTAKKVTPSPTIEIDDTLTADDDDSLNGSSDNSSSSTNSPTASPTKIGKWENAVDSSKEDEDSNRSSSEKDPTLEEIYEDLTPEQVEYLKHHEFVDEEKEAAKISVLYFVITLVLMIFTAQQMSESPDGVYANVCRLGITVAGLVVKIILLPFRKFCGLGGKQGYSHHLVTTSDPYSRTSRMEII